MGIDRKWAVVPKNFPALCARHLHSYPGPTNCRSLDTLLVHSNYHFTFTCYCTRTIIHISAQVFLLVPFTLIAVCPAPSVGSCVQGAVAILNIKSFFNMLNGVATCTLDGVH